MVNVFIFRLNKKIDGVNKSLGGKNNLYFLYSYNLNAPLTTFFH